MAEPLNEIEFGTGLVARGMHYLIFDTAQAEQIKRTRYLAQAVFASPLMTVMNPVKGSHVLMKKRNKVSYQLPDNIHLLTLAVIPETSQVFLTFFDFFFFEN